MTEGSVADDLRHERGHNSQLMMMGIATYGFTVGIPSPAKLGRWAEENMYYYAPWETMADILGGVTHRYGAPIPQQQITDAWVYYTIGTHAFPFTALYWLGEKNEKSNFICVDINRVYICGVRSGIIFL